MTDDEDDVEDREVPPVVTTVCHSCDGSGWVVQPVLSLHRGTPHTGVYSTQCHWCTGVGAVSGLVAPF